MRAGRRPWLVGVVALLTAASFALRAPCLGPGPAGWAALVPGCRGDLGLMWDERGLAAGLVPYLQPFLDPATGRLVTVEYPVLTGMLMWLFSLPGSFAVFVALSTALMGAAAGWTAVVLDRFAGPAAWFWAASPVLVHYLSYNYDALPALTTVLALGMLAGRSPVEVGTGRVLGAAAILGVGGALKLYPLLLLLPLALWLLFGRPGPSQPTWRRRLGRALGAAGAGAGVFVAINLPVLVANPTGWLLPYSFQATRPIDVTTLSVWHFAGQAFPAVPLAAWMAAATLATGLGLLTVCALCWAGARRKGSFPLLGSAVAVLAVYLALNKVFSPQYALWMLPLLVLARFGPRPLVTFQAIDVVLFWSLGATTFVKSVRPDLAVTAAAVLVLAVAARLGYMLWLGGAGPRRADATG